MAKKHKPEEIVAKLRQVDVLTSQGTPIADAIRSIGVTEVTYYRWRNEYGGLKSDQVKRLKDLETENARLRKAISDLTSAGSRSSSPAVSGRRADRTHDAPYGGEYGGTAGPAARCENAQAHCALRRERIAACGRFPLRRMSISPFLKPTTVPSGRRS